MITPEEIRRKALQHWENQSFLKAALKGESFFPLHIPFARVKSREVLEDFAGLREGLKRLREGSKEHKGCGYTVHYSPVRHRQMGAQDLPEHILVESVEDFLGLVGKRRDYERFRAMVELILAEQPGLRPWMEARPAAVLEHGAHWPQLLRVCRFFREHPRSGRYLRELDIPGVDTKFVEQHKAILSMLLDQLLPSEAVDSTVTGLSRHGFERRYGLQYDEPLIRFRLLDHALLNAPGLDDMSVPLSRFRQLTIPCTQVFITENKMNGLVFPSVPGSMVIFGLGYGIQSLQGIQWLSQREIAYWGDIDTHGFAMLSQLRGYYPRTRSFLMDRETLMAFRELWVPEPADKRRLTDLPNLTLEERALYEALRDNALGDNIRLEQERIAFCYVCRKLMEH